MSMEKRAFANRADIYAIYHGDKTVADAVFASMVAAFVKLTVGLHKLVASPTVMIEFRLLHPLKDHTEGSASRLHQAQQHTFRRTPFLFTIRAGP